jgi:RND superfamily putative drug exporter
MRAFMIGLSHLVRRNRWAVIGAWIVLVGVSVPFSQKDNEDLSAGLLTRVRERVGAGMSTADAARAGTALAGRTIAAAATIMVGVFVVFTIFGVPTIQAAGLGAAVAVAASALFVQLAFMPSLMILLGERTWWLPRWLDRALPRVELE